MKNFRTFCQFAAVLAAIAVLTPLLLLYIAGDYVVQWAALVRQA